MVSFFFCLFFFFFFFFLIFSFFFLLFFFLFLLFPPLPKCRERVRGPDQWTKGDLKGPGPDRHDGLSRQGRRPAPHSPQRLLRLSLLPQSRRICQHGEGTHPRLSVQFLRGEDPPGDNERRQGSTRDRQTRNFPPSEFDPRTPTPP